MPKFRVGDKVKYNYNGQMCIGTIRELHSESDEVDNVCAVEFKSNVPFADTLHDCDGFVPSGMGWWIRESSLTLVQRCAVTWPPEQSKPRYKQFQTKVL